MLRVIDCHTAYTTYYYYMITFTTSRIAPRLACLFSHKNALINTPPEEYVRDRPILKENIWREPDLTYRVSLPNPEITRDPSKQRLVPHPQGACCLY